MATPKIVAKPTAAELKALTARFVDKFEKGGAG